MTSPQQITQASDLPLGSGVRLITSNQHGLVALDKPAGLMSHPNKDGESKRSLLQASYDYDDEVYTWQVGEVQHRAWLVNRLDSPTSGVILLALNEEINTAIKQLFSTHKVTKVYYALVRRVPSVPAGSWSDSLKKDVYRGKKLIKGGQRIPAEDPLSSRQSRDGRISGRTASIAATDWAYASTSCAMPESSSPNRRRPHLR